MMGKFFLFGGIRITNSADVIGVENIAVLPVLMRFWFLIVKSQPFLLASMSLASN
jgi:hypothetical protein